MGNKHTCYEAFRTGLRQRTRPKGIELDSREQVSWAEEYLGGDEWMEGHHGTWS
jgi:hypothetical protein